MSNHGDGNKYASVNLNKSYGYQPHHRYNQSGTYGANRWRGGGGYGSGGGGGSLVVLSRPRSSQNAGSKLSVPPPLNLPSLRKEHERVDSSGSSFHSSGGIAGSGTRPASSGMGWSKPATTTADGDIPNHTAEGVTRGSNGLNKPLVSRVGAGESMERGFHHVEKVATLRGEDFPSLKASLPSASVSGQKQKEGLNQKQKQAAGEFSNEPRGISGMGSSLVDMRPQNQSGRSQLGNEFSRIPSFPSEQVRKKEYFSGPLPLVHLTPRSDWADDERDTSHGLRDRDRDHGYSKNEPFWDRGFDLTRPHVLPQKHAAPNLFDKPGQRENENPKSSLTQVRPVSGGGREANAWRVSTPLQNEGTNNNKNIYGVRPSSRGREADKKSNYVLSASRESVWNNTGAREALYQHVGRQPWNNTMDSSSNMQTFNRDGYGIEHQSRDKHAFKSDKPHVEDPFMKDFGDSGFDVHDPFSVLGVAKKKKEALKRTEFHDPVRESFEAELERVQKMQEEERRRIIEEQERVIEIARTEEEEKLRLAREQDEQQRKLEEEAREAAFKNEQERLEVAKRAEELRKSKEEEKHRLVMEEERRKQAAKQKLLELEEKISRRQAEAAKGCGSASTVSEDKFLGIVKEKECADVVDWEDSERMVDRITTSSTVDLSVPIRSFVINAASQFSRDGSFGFPDRQKPTWRKEDIESGSNSRFIPQNMENVPPSPQDEFFGTTGYLNSPSYIKPGFLDHSVDQNWRNPGDERTHGRNFGMESESRESFGEQYGNTGSVACWDNDEWTLNSNEQLHEQEEYNEDEDGYQAEDKIHVVDANIDLAEELEEMHLEDKDFNLVLGFNEGVEVEIPRDDFEKCQQNSETAFPLPQQTVDSLDEERPSIETSHAEKGAEPVEVSKPLSMHNISRSFQGAETTIQNLTIHPNSGRQSFELTKKVDSTISSTVFTHPVIPPHSIGQHSSPLQTTIPPVSTTSAEMEEPVKFQFGLFSGPSLIPSPFPAIQIGSIQMPLPLHPQFGSSLTHIQQPQSHIIQFGHIRYTSPISHGVLPPPPRSVAQANGLSTYTLNQNSGTSESHQPGQGNSANVPARNAATSVSNPQLSVLRRPMNVSDRGSLKNANISSATASIDAAVLPEKQPELSGKSELPSRKIDRGKSNLVERKSRYQVQSDTTAVRNSGLHLPGTAEVSRIDSGGYRRYQRQRVEFRFRESKWPSSEENRNGNRRAQNSTNNGSRKYVVSNKSQKQALDNSMSSFNAMQKINSGGSFESNLGKDVVVKYPLSPSSGQAKLKRNMISEKEIDAPLQSGVRVFGQQGIEAPSDDDDFIEVRSKRQMLNDRREQREKELKEKSQASKASRKSRSTFQNSTTVARSNRSPPTSRVENNKQFNPVSNRQLLAPIGTPFPKTDSRADERAGSDKSTQASSVLPVIPKTDQTSASGFVVSNKNKVLDNSHTSVGAWGNQLTYQPVIALTQSQLDEAMKPESLLSCVSVENGANRISEPNLTSKSVVPKNNTFSRSTIPINSLLAEGAVTSSTVIPPGGGRTENNSSLYIEKDNKHRNSSSSGMEICEAEATASAIAVATITNDEAGGHALSNGSVLPVETKIYGGTKLDEDAASDIVGGQSSLSKAEESLIVSLPTDLSVDTPISLWPPLPSPHNSNQMITHFPPGLPHYPFYDVNPMLRGPIFAFGPDHDAGGNQSQSQKGPGIVSGPPTTWQQQGHSGVDSFYAPPASVTGPFLTPPGAIPGVQGPPHMFVYNHFAPVGQFGGLSFMGTTYIPSGKQPDWKHNPIVSSSPVGGDGDVNNPNAASMQCNIVHASLQHLPMPMFDPSSFQSSSQEMPVRARLPYMPFSGPPTMQIQKQQEAADGSNLPSPQFNNNILPPHPPPNRYPNIQASTVSDEMDSSNAYSSTTCAPPPKPTTTLSDPNSNNTQNPAGPSFKPPPQQQSSQKKNTPSQHVGGSSHQHQHNRRSGFHGRNQPMARERGFPNNVKVKQIYVAKQTGNSNASASSTTTTSPSI